MVSGVMWCTLQVGLLEELEEEEGKRVEGKGGGVRAVTMVTKATREAEVNNITPRSILNHPISMVT